MLVSSIKSDNIRHHNPSREGACFRVAHSPSTEICRGASATKFLDATHAKVHGSTKFRNPQGDQTEQDFYSFDHATGRRGRMQASQKFVTRVLKRDLFVGRQKLCRGR